MPTFEEPKLLKQFLFEALKLCSDFGATTFALLLAVDTDFAICASLEQAGILVNQLASQDFTASPTCKRKVKLWQYQVYCFSTSRLTMNILKHAWLIYDLFWQIPWHFPYRTTLDQKMHLLEITSCTSILLATISCPQVQIFKLEKSGTSFCFHVPCYCFYLSRSKHWNCCADSPKATVAMSARLKY